MKGEITSTEAEVNCFGNDLNKERCHNNKVVLIGSTLLRRDVNRWNISVFVRKTGNEVPGREGVHL